MNATSTTDDGPAQKVTVADRRAEKVTRPRTIPQWPTAMLAALDAPIGFRPSSPKGGAQ